MNMKILIIKSGAIGDVLMTTPFLRALRKRFGNATINYLTSKESAPALKNNKYISGIISVRSSIFHSLNPINKILRIERIRKEKYDLCFVLDKSWLAGLFAFSTGIKKRIGFNRNGEGFFNTINADYKELKHEIEYYLELAYLAGAENEKNKKIDLFLTDKDKLFAKKFFENHAILSSGNAIGIAPGGGKNPGIKKDSTRIWPEQKFIKLIYLLKNKTIILFGGESDRALCERIASKTSSSRANVINIAGETTIHQTAALMGRCKCIITNDAGPMHIASSANKKVISIFGPTHPLRKAPLHRESIWLWKNEDIYDSRCDLYSTKYAEGKMFMERILPEDVYKIVEELK